MSEVPKRRTAHKPGIGRPRGMPPSQMAGKNFCLHGDTNATLTPPLLSTPVLSSPFQLISCHHSSSLCTFLPSFSHIFCVQTYSWNGHRPPPPPQPAQPEARKLSSILQIAALLSLQLLSTKAVFTLALRSEASLYSLLLALLLLSLFRKLLSLRHDSPGVRM